MSVTLNTARPVGGITVPEIPTPVAAPVDATPRFQMGPTGLYRGDSGQALSRAAALCGKGYGSEGMSIIRNARVTNLAACEEGRAEFVTTIYNLAQPER